MTSWQLRTTDRFEKTFEKLSKRNKSIAQRISSSLEKLLELDDPSVRCKPLQGDLSRLWRYRAGDWRVILDIRNDELVILALDVGHRSQVYSD